MIDFVSTSEIEEEWQNNIRGLFDEAGLAFTVTTTTGPVRYVNLDNAATTPPFVPVIQQMLSSFTSYGSVHRGAGQKSKITTDSYESTRATIRKFVNAPADSYVVFTKNTTEAINHAASLWAPVKGKVLVSDIEHSSNLLPWLAHGEIIQYPTNIHGEVELQTIEDIFVANPDIKLVAITGCSNLTSYKPPVHKIAEIAHAHNSKILVDVCQLIQHEHVDMKDESDPQHLDFIAFSGHKMYAPLGAGVLIGPKPFFDEVMPYQVGGGNLPYLTKDLGVKRFLTVQTHDPGTPNALGVIALEAAIKTIESLGTERIARYEHALVHAAYDLLVAIPGVRMFVPRHLLGSTIPFEIEHFDVKLTAEILANEFGIGVRAGSFCVYELLRKLKGIDAGTDDAIGKEVDCGITKNIPGVVRASFSLVNCYEDVTRLVSAISEIAARKPESYHGAYEQDATKGTWAVIASS